MPGVPFRGFLLACLNNLVRKPVEVSFDSTSQTYMHEQALRVNGADERRGVRLKFEGDVIDATALQVSFICLSFCHRRCDHTVHVSRGGAGGAVYVAHPARV